MLADPIFQWLSQYAYQPEMVYLAVVLLMLASSFGFPLPEEVTLISVGLLAYMGTHPTRYPPPYEGAPVVEVYEAALVCFLAVMMSDFLIFMLGRKFGRRMIRSHRFKRWISDAAMLKIEKWTEKYGIFAAAIFRFTPGVRFPGHLACGMLNFPTWKFLLVDGFVAAISVPTQVIILAKYGEPILETLKEFKVIVFSILGIAVVCYFVWKFFKKGKTPSIPHLK